VDGSVCDVELCGSWGMLRAWWGGGGDGGGDDADISWILMVEEDVCGDGCMQCNGERGKQAQRASCNSVPFAAATDSQPNNMKDTREESIAPRGETLKFNPSHTHSSFIHTSASLQRGR
jgi:hypothetical protein